MLPLVLPVLVLQHRKTKVSEREINRSVSLSQELSNKTQRPMRACEVLAGAVPPGDSRGECFPPTEQRVNAELAHLRQVFTGEATPVLEEVHSNTTTKSPAFSKLYFKVSKVQVLIMQIYSV